MGKIGKYDYNLGSNKYDFKDRESNIQYYIDYMLLRTNGMFVWENLPSTLDQTIIEDQLQRNGYSFIYQHEGNLYSFVGSLHGQENSPYNLPTKINITNQALNLYADIDLDSGILILNDIYKMGLLPIFERYGTQLAHSDITMILYNINMRNQTMISATDETSRQSAELYFKRKQDGEIGIIAENKLFEGIRANNLPMGGSLGDLIEYHNFIKTSLFNEVGMDSIKVMKKERLVSAEAEQDNNIFPLIDGMYMQRLSATEQFREKFGIDVTVKFGSIWEKERMEIMEPTEPTEPIEPTEPTEGGKNGAIENDIRE